MSVELYALFSYAFTAAIALVMIGAVVLSTRLWACGNIKEVWNNNGRKHRCTIIPWHCVFDGSRYNHRYCQNCTSVSYTHLTLPTILLV